MFKNLSSGFLQFYQVECIVSTSNKNFVVSCITYFDKNRKGRIMVDGTYKSVPYSERLEQSLLKLLDKYYFRVPGLQSLSVRVYPIHPDSSFDDCKHLSFLPPNTKQIATDLVSWFISDLYSDYSKYINK